MDLDSGEFVEVEVLQEPEENKGWRWLVRQEKGEEEEENLRSNQSRSRVEAEFRISVR